MIMPDHVHMFCIPGTFPPTGIKQWNTYWKAELRRALQLDQSIWLRDGWDTQIRDHRHYDEKLAYMQMNPVRKELVERPEDWPYQGRLHIIRW
jgi:putative transposase